MRNFRRWLLVGFALLFACETGFAQQAPSKDVAYPTKPVRMVVPFGAGGSTDVLSRIVAQRLLESLATQFVVDNRPGANGIVGTEIVARATADGWHKSGVIRAG